MKPILKKYQGVWICKTSHYKRKWNDLTQFERISIVCARRWCEGMNNKCLTIDYVKSNETPNYAQLGKRYSL